MWPIFKKHNGEAVDAGFLELKARGTSCMEYEVEGCRPSHRPKSTWKEVVQKIAKHLI